jgi:drug/metabolite transporter (DMT)-like permease
MKPSSRLSAILQAVLVTFLWSTSWVLIKLGLRNDLPPVSFAGMRYFLAFLCLAPFVLASPRLRNRLLSLSSQDWLRLALMGVITYAFSQSLQYLSLASLPSATLSLVLNLTSVLTAISGIWLLHEKPTALQWIGVAVVAAGVGVYFLPVALEPGQVVGLGFAVACMAGNTASGLFGRQINRRQDIPASIVTFVSMGFGSILMLAFGGLTGGFGRPSGSDWLILGWLALVNTALAFTLWNTTLRTLTAVESSILNNLMMPQIAILALLFLGETLSGKDLAGLALVFAGVLIVQLRGRQRPAAP